MNKEDLIRQIELKLHSKPHEVSRGVEKWSMEVILAALQEVL